MQLRLKTDLGIIRVSLVGYEKNGALFIFCFEIMESMSGATPPRLPGTKWQLSDSGNRNSGNMTFV